MTDTSSGPMTLEDIDRALAAWDSKRALASQNVLDLMDNPMYKQLTGSGGITAAPLTGLTEARCTPALKALSELWGLFARMGQVIDQAHSLRKAVKGLFKSDQLLEIEKLLTGPSVKIAVKLDFSQRSLLSPAEVSSGLTLDRVMESMVKAYDEGKAIVLEVDQATSSLNQALADSIRQVKLLQQSARELGEGDLPELRATDAKVTEFLNLIYSDPLGVKVGFQQEIEPLLKQTSDRINGLKQLFEQVKRDLAHAHDTMSALTETQKKAAAVFAERALKVYLDDAGNLPRPIDESTVTALKEWLDRLDNALAQGKWKPLQMGVANWSIQATERLHSCQMAYAANLAPLTKRQELREFLDILKAKAQSYGRSEDEDLAAIEKAARALLYTRPTRLVEADKLVQNYAANLR